MVAGANRKTARAERGGILFKLLVFLAVVAAFAALAWMALLPYVACYEIRRKTGFDASVERLVANPLSGVVEARGFVLQNPDTFPAREFLDVRAFRAQVRLTSLWSDQVVFETMSIEVPSITLVKRADGAMNVELFREQVQDTQAAAGRSAGGAPFLVRELRLKVDRCVLLDYTGDSPKRREVQAGIDQTFKDVSDIEQVLTPAVLRPLAPMTEMLSGLFPKNLGEKLGAAAKTSAEFLKEAGRKTGEAVKGFFQTLEEKKKP